MKYELLLLKNCVELYNTYQIACVCNGDEKEIKFMEDKKMKYENITLGECIAYNKIANMIFECDADKKEVKFKREEE